MGEKLPGAPSESQPAVLDIEHAPVAEDPRTWSKARKVYPLPIRSVSCIY